MRRAVLLAATIALFAGILAADALSEDRLFSAQENRLLAQRPGLSAGALLDGSYGRDFEAWVTDQFPGRNGWIAVRNIALRLMGKRDENGVYFAPGNTLVERHEEGSVDAEAAARKVQALSDQAEEIASVVPGSVAVLLVPSAGAVQSWRLPPFAPEFDQAGWLEETGRRLSEAGAVFLDGAKILTPHGRETIYYGTDHHWTTLGAFYGYRAFEEAMGRRRPEREDYERIPVKEDFRGTLQARVNLPAAADVIERFKRAGEGEHETAFPGSGETADSCYFYDRLNTKDAYAFFLGGNDPLVRISGDGPEERTILLIRDSYANCFAPFLTENYGTIWLMDPRYYRGDAVELVKKLAPQDVLYLYQIFHFLAL